MSQEQDEFTEQSKGLMGPENITGDNPKNKGGRPKGRPKYGNCKLTLYLSEEEIQLFQAFVNEGWHDKNSSGAGRYLLLSTLHDWDKKGRKMIGLFPEGKQRTARVLPRTGTVE